MTTRCAAVPSVPLALLFLALLLPGRALAADGPDVLARRLLLVPRGTLVQLQRDDGSIAEGCLAAVDADTVRLAAAPGGSTTTAWPLDEVVRARRKVAAADPAFRGGAALGAVLGAAAGIGFVDLIDKVGEGEDEVTAADYAAGGIALAVAGALAVGGVVALVATGSTTWDELPPAEGPARRHLELQGGWATADDPRGISYDGLRLQGWLARRATPAVSWGPEVSWSGLGGTLQDSGGTITVNDTWSVGVAARLAMPGAGLRPYFKAGLGWYGREETWLGVSLGCGLQWRTADGGGPVAEVRSHARSTGIDDRAGNGQLAATLGWSFAF